MSMSRQSVLEMYKLSRLNSLYRVLSYLTVQGKFLLEKPIVAQVVNKLPNPHANGRPITVFTRCGSVQIYPRLRESSTQPCTIFEGHFNIIHQSDFVYFISKCCISMRNVVALKCMWDIKVEHQAVLMSAVERREMSILSSTGASTRYKLKRMIGEERKGAAILNKHSSWKQKPGSPVCGYRSGWCSGSVLDWCSGWPLSRRVA